MRELPPELRNVADEYDRTHNAEVLDSYDDLFDALRGLHEVYPHWRFGQLVVALAGWSGTTKPGEAYHVPDERLLRAAREHLHHRTLERERAASNPAEPADRSARREPASTVAG